ncbi:hypothetical protein WIW50_16470 [Flavobacteriaceae bacterium 3-367]|uniref:hypothetical protein n=1 Tax=Eudoraea algarum TaxID=3417568 RepID=UPI00326EE82A
MLGKKTRTTYKGFFKSGATADRNGKKSKAITFSRGGISFMNGLQELAFTSTDFEFSNSDLQLDAGALDLFLFDRTNRK